MIGHIDDLIRRIHDGRVALFIGAGATCAAGGPDSAKLVEEIKANFPRIEQSLTGFLDVCQDVQDTPPYNKSELEEFIINRFAALKPINAHFTMAKYNWVTIFTTNYDDLIEIAYRESKKKLKPLYPIYSSNSPVNVFDTEQIHLYKIMGTIRASEGESGQMVLTHSDDRRALINRTKHLQTLYDVIKDGTILFIGYSFKDRIVFDIIDDLVAEKTIDNLRWNYAIFDKLPKMDEKTKHQFSRRRIIPIECNFVSFFDYLRSKALGSVSKSVSRNVYLKIKGSTLKISHSDARQYSEQFHFLHEDIINQPPGVKDDFFLGINDNWGAFRENWDFKRENYLTSGYPKDCEGKISFEIGGLKDRVFKELRKADVEENKVFLLKGMAGVGKTLTLKRLAYDVYQSSEAPVILIDKTKVSFDYKAIASFIEDLNQQVIDTIENGEEKAQLKPLIVIDDAAGFIRHINGLKNYLSSRGRPVLIVAAERTNVWESACESMSIRIPDESVFYLSEYLSDDEKVRIIEHFYSLEYIQSKGAYWDELIDLDFENSYFATIYSLVHPSKKPLNEIIKDQYQRLPDLTQKAFKYVCCFHQFDLPIPIELLVRSLRCGWDTLYSEIIERDANKVIFEEGDEVGNVLLRTHHRIIAKKTVEFFFGDPEEQKETLIEILQYAMLNNRKEREIVEKLLIHNIGPNAKPAKFTYNQQRQIFEVICRDNATRSLVHHWGVLESDDRNYHEAERLLKRSLEMPKYDIEFYRGESDQNIKTSLGTLYSRLGIECLKQKKPETAKEYFQKAEFEFRSAKYGDFPNPLAYHGHAYMWYLRGLEETDNLRRINSFAEAMEILSTAKDNLNEEDLKIIFELEEKVWIEIGYNEIKIQEVIDTIRDEYNSASGYYLLGEFYWRKSESTRGKEKFSLLKRALRVINAGLEYFPLDERCLRLQSMLIKEVDPENIRDYYRSLQKWEASSKIPNAKLLYELGRVSFILGYYDYSEKYFEKLQKGVGLGLKLRSRPQDPILDNQGKKKEFEGRIIKIFSPTDGLIRCDTLREFRKPIAFRPVACKHTLSVDDNVRFFVEFSYRGPRAENVRRV